MSCRPILRDLRCRNDIVCRSCLASRAKQPAQAWWAASYSSQASQTVSKARPRPQPRPNEDITRQPTKAEMARYLEGLKSLRSPGETKSNADDFSVRFFEQGDQRREELSSEQAFGESLGGIDASQLRDNLLHLREGLRNQDDKDAFREVLKEMGEDWGKINSAEDVEKIIAKMEDYARSIDFEIKEASTDLPKGVLEQLIGDLPELSVEDDRPSDGSRDSMPQILINPDEITTNRRRKLTKFNSIITRFILAEKETGLKQKAVQSLYKAYHSTRLALAQNWSSVSPALWEVLWRAFSSEKDSSNRMSRIAVLARDMSDAKVTLSPTQQVLAIEAVFVDGWETKAIENWRRCISTLGAETSETFQSFWELGARMYCRVGDLSQAERATNKLLSRNMSPLILIPLIRTCCEQGTEEGKQTAWAAYRQMRELLGKKMTLTVYDQVISCFLTAHQVENALYAFVDMMSNGRIDMTKQRHMPSVIANKFFLGKWLKRLIGAGDLDGAFSVVEFMRGKGVEASPIHLNGLIGAWQRSGGADDLEKADALAWQMVESRLKFVARRKANSDPSSNGSTSSPNPPPMDLPRATIETFSLLAENYRQRNLHGRLEALWDAFREAEISPDAFMMNQLLESLIQEGQPQEALALYHSLTESSNVVPDPYTFSALWKTLGVNRYHIRDAGTQTKEVEATRAMFKATVKHRDVFQPDGIDGQLARKILHTFRRLEDNAGFLVAITAFKETFKFLPPETLVLEMVLGTTRLSWDTPSQRRKLMLAKGEIDRELLAWADSNTVNLEDEKGRGAALYAYLQKRFWPAEGDEEEKRRIFVEVARQMGVYELLGPKTDAGGR
ncbi:hypothetical protein V8C37DRAFT_389014 [Trichoderma ceciliae]